MILNQTETGHILEKTLKTALQAGADEAAVELSGSEKALSRFARNMMTQNVIRKNIHLRIGVSVNNRENYISINKIDDESIKRTVNSCVKNARFMPVNREHLPPVSVSKYPEVRGWDSDAEKFNEEHRAEIVGETCSYAEKMHLDAFGTVQNNLSFTSVMNSNGLFAYHRFTDTGYSVTMRTPDGRGSAREEQFEYSPRFLEPELLMKQAAETARQTSDPETLEPGDYKVILTSQAAANFLAPMFFGFDARKIDENRSFLSRYKNGSSIINQKVFSEKASFRSIVGHERYPGLPFGSALSLDGDAGQGAAANLFSSGLPVKENYLIKEGHIKNVFYPYYWAVKKGIEPYGLPRQILMEGEDASLEELIKTTDDGILVSNLWYIRFVDPNTMLLTGLTRDGTFRIKNGRIVAPVRNFRFNESPLVSLNHIEALGEPRLIRYYQMRLIMPPMRIDKFTFSSVSTAV